MVGHNMRRLLSNKPSLENDASQSMIYEIRIKGHLGDQWSDWFDGLTVTLEANGDTLITGPVVDQAALHGLLKKVRDLGMPLISVINVEPDQASGARPAAPHVKPVIVTKKERR